MDNNEIKNKATNDVPENSHTVYDEAKVIYKQIKNDTKKPLIIIACVLVISAIIVAIVLAATGGFEKLRLRDCSVSVIEQCVLNPDSVKITSMTYTTEEKNGDTFFYITGKFTSKNAFGVEIQNSYETMVRKDSKKHYYTYDVIINGNRFDL